MTTTSMTPQDIYNLIELKKRRLRLQQDELMTIDRKIEALRDEKKAKEEQMVIEEEELEILERYSNEMEVSVEMIDGEEKIGQWVEFDPVEDDRISLDIDQAYSSLDEDMERISKDGDQAYSSLDEDIERISKDGDQAIRQIEGIIKELKIEKKVVDDWTELEIDNIRRKTKYWDRVFCVLEKKNIGRAQKGLLTTPIHFSAVKAREFGLVEKYGRSNTTRYQYQTLGKPVQEVKELIIKLRDFALTIRN